MNPKKEAIEIIKIAMAEVEWNYPMDYVVAFKTAIEALEKQIPKKPAFDAWSHNCPTCLATLVDNNKIHRDGAKKHYCDECGQALDWSDEDDE